MTIEDYKRQQTPKQKRRAELKQAIALANSMIDCWNSDYLFYQEKIKIWEKELEELEDVE